MVGLSEGGMRTDQCKSTFVVTQAHMEWALKERDKLCGPWDCWKKGQSSGGWAGLQ